MFLEVGLDGKGVVNFWRSGSGFLEIAIINLTLQILFTSQCYLTYYIRAD